MAGVAVVLEQRTDFFSEASLRGSTACSHGQRAGDNDRSTQRRKTHLSSTLNNSTMTTPAPPTRILYRNSTWLSGLHWFLSLPNDSVLLTRCRSSKLRSRVD